MPDQRKSPRKSSFLASYADEGFDGDTLFCIVRDLSARGARLETSGAGRLPERFDLQINGRKTLLHVEVCWRTDTEVGVRFLAKSLDVRPILAGCLDARPGASAL